MSSSCALDDLMFLDRTLRVSVGPGLGRAADMTPRKLLTPSTAKNPTSSPSLATLQTQKIQQLARKISRDNLSQSTNHSSQQNLLTRTLTPKVLLVQRQTPTTTLTTTTTQQETSSLPPAVPPPVVDSRPRCRALYAHQGLSDNELSFQPNDIMLILRKDPGGWWEAELNGLIGWVPHNYVEEL